MHLTVPSPKSGSTREVQRPQSKSSALDYAVGEINAFIAIRDELLIEAEELKTSSKLHSLMIANEFVLACLDPAHPPYEAQSLPETDAVRERERCDQIKLRIADLHPQVTLGSAPDGPVVR